MCIRDRHCACNHVLFNLRRALQKCGSEKNTHGPGNQKKSAVKMSERVKNALEFPELFSIQASPKPNSGGPHWASGQGIDGVAPGGSAAPAAARAISSDLAQQRFAVPAVWRFAMADLTRLQEDKVRSHAS